MRFEPRSKRLIKKAGDARLSAASVTEVCGEHQRRASTLV